MGRDEIIKIFHAPGTGRVNDFLEGLDPDVYSVEPGDYPLLCGGCGLCGKPEYNGFKIIMMKADLPHVCPGNTAENFKKSGEFPGVIFYAESGDELKWELCSGDYGTFKFRDGRGAIRELIKKVAALNQDEPPTAHARKPEILGRSQGIENVRRFIKSSAPIEMPVLIEGESGTGKELVARAIHDSSGKKGPFVAINCASIPVSLLENEIFGHESGAFSGASVLKKGLFETAGNGTLFIDEIGEMPFESQAKLLRVLENGSFMRLGGVRELKANARVIAATNKVLENEIQDKRFRLDLYYRLSVLKVTVPPLRERKEDIPEIAAHFVNIKDSGKKLSDNAVEEMMGYDWPGNIRELRNVIESAVIFTVNSDTIPGDEIRKHIRPIRAASNYPGHVKLADFLDDAEKKHLIHMLKINNGCKIKAAKDLGISRSSFYRKLLKYGLIAVSVQEHK